MIRAEFVFQFDFAIYIQIPLACRFLFISTLFIGVPWSFKKVDQTRTRAELSGLVTGLSAETLGEVVSPSSLFSVSSFYFLFLCQV